MPAPAWIQRAQSDSGGLSNSFTPTMPGSLVDGNLLVMSVLAFHSSGGALSDTIPDWRLRAVSTGMGFTDLCVAGVYTRTAAAPNTAPDVGGTGGSNLFQTIHVEVSEVGGVYSTAPVTASASGTPAASTIVTPATTASYANSLAVYLAFENNGSLSFSASPGGTTNRYAEKGPITSFCQVWADEPVPAGVVAADSFTRSGTFNAVAHTLVVASSGAADQLVPPHILGPR